MHNSVHSNLRPKPPLSFGSESEPRDKLADSQNKKCWLAYWESDERTGKKWVESPVRYFWVYTTIVHELAHTFETFLSWYYADKSDSMDKPIPKGFTYNTKGKPEVGFWAETKLLGGWLSSGNDRTGRSSRLRVKQYRFQMIYIADNLVGGCSNSCESGR
jgi:hypothetical protein